MRIIASVAERASTGHYLDRAIALAEAFGDPHLGILRANKEYLDALCKPAGLDEVLRASADYVLFWCREAGLAAEDIRPIAWGLCLDALERIGWQTARTNGTPAQRSDQ